MIKKTVLASTGEEVHSIDAYGKSSINPPMGYTDVLIPRSGMKNDKKGVIQRVRNDKLKTVKV